MTHWFLAILPNHPEVTFFLTIGIGYLIGRLRIGSFTLGAVTGTLLAGVLVGQLGVRVSGEVKQCFFLLFLFSIGFRTGPQFFHGLRSGGLAQAGLAAIVATTGLIVAYLVSLVFGYAPGTGAGLLAGAMTESATIGTAGDAITHLAIAPDLRDTFVNQIPVAFAVSYLVGVVGAAWFLSQIGPKLMGVDLAAECRKLEEQTQGDGAIEPLSARREFELRAYRVAADSRWVSQKVASLEQAFLPDNRIFVARMRRRDEMFEPDTNATFAEGDTLAIAGRREILVSVLGTDAHGLIETDDRALQDLPVDLVDVVLTNREWEGKPLSALARDQTARGLFLRRLTRAGHTIPIAPWMTVQRGDVLTIAGSPVHTADAIKRLGYADRPTEQTNMAFVAAGIVLGAIIGIPALVVGKIEIGLSLSVGVLLGGLVCGWLRSVWPIFGRIPGPTLWIFESLGLSGFIAIVGLAAGPDFVAGLRQSGVTLLVAGAITVIIPHAVGVVVGHRVFKMHPGVILGVCAGAGTATPALAAIQEAARSSVPTLGYGVAYAVGNVLLALWGTVIVALLV
jgi:putative transport protein